jgi:DNA (cytosine-5)-methyltransferase 1
LIDEANTDWDAAEKTAKLLTQMSPLQRARVEALSESGARAVGAVFRRIRVERGARVQRAEARFDGLAGCLRTPAGGASPQIMLFVEGDQIPSRQLSPREAARRMGAPDH